MGVRVPPFRTNNFQPIGFFGVNLNLRHSDQAPGRGTASGKKTSGGVSERISSDGCGAIENLRQHRGNVAATWGESAASPHFLAALGEAGMENKTTQQVPVPQFMNTIRSLKQAFWQSTITARDYEGQPIQCRTQSRGFNLLHQLGSHSPH